ncbi:ribose-5-phosphate isomerase RpiA [Halobacillus massiliensis]|uniref:ribose-5-phosphate isomerase RpiA n=1 Tax=Halobacillus massiliensis TaxID=1926286 RepID=UPI0009E58406|nr:ribose-5-phosphate isomerase RpiA [Halobacillus massiliensis]
MKKAERSKRSAGEKAVDYIEHGMTIGLGSGSTVYWMLKKLGEHVQKGLSVKGVPSSIKTEKWAAEFGVPLTSFTEVDKLDLAIDGADEISPDFTLLKGGGGSLVREKIVNSAADRVITIADHTKCVSQLGKRALPVEVVPFGWEVTAKQIKELDAGIQLRKVTNEPFVSDNGNYILDCAFGTISHPEILHNHLLHIPGVVETGLFISLTDTVIIAEDQDIKILSH